MSRMWLLALAAVVHPFALAQAKDVAPPRMVAPAEGQGSSETLAVEISANAETLWSGRLRIGNGYSSASFSQSINEYGDMCRSGALSPNAGRQANSQVSLNISRANWQQEPDKFSLNLSVNRPLPPCDGEGSNMTGFNRVVTVAAGGTVMVQGDGGIRLRITRLQN